MIYFLFFYFLPFCILVEFVCVCVCVCVCVVIYLNLLIYLEIGIAWSADEKCQLHNGRWGAHLHRLCGGVGACLQLCHSPLHLNSAPPPPPGGGCGHCNFIQVHTVDSAQTLQDSSPWYNCQVTYLLTPGFTQFLTIIIAEQQNRRVFGLQILLLLIAFIYLCSLLSFIAR